MDDQADLSLRWAHSHFVGFVMLRLIFFTKFPELRVLFFSSASFYFDVETRLEGSVRPEKIGRVIVRNSLRALPDESVFTLQITASDNGPEEVRRGSCRVIIKVSKGVIDPKPRWTPGLKSKVYVPEVKNQITVIF